ncbi:hypothetical protein CTA2_11958 [Colletotrichum tanaceti]|uniref:Uncharacterized protein n=1 Tax=Colletotrichum tanaceti TaxID=1306861 RepID=A0A4V6DHC5_9PEZI|nr:hypothetical protein CTA2_11958 [Colletotrichum tanaceti]TKW49546.1 hypothetical protein CTA1_5570 [Colletotrichum tanaceti]
MMVGGRGAVVSWMRLLLEDVGKWDILTFGSRKADREGERERDGETERERNRERERERVDLRINNSTPSRRIPQNFPSSSPPTSHLHPSLITVAPRSRFSQVTHFLLLINKFHSFYKNQKHPKMKSFSTLLLAGVAATGVMSAAVGKSAQLAELKGVADTSAEHHVKRTLQDAGVRLAEPILNSAARLKYLESPVVNLNNNLQKRNDAGLPPTMPGANPMPSTTPLPEPDRNRPIVTPENVYVLMCTLAGFQGECLTFGAPPGKCVSYQDFEAANSTAISSRFENNLSALSSNTGGTCQYFLYAGCNDKGDDRGLSGSYFYNLAVALPSDPRVVEYENQISSWRC